MAFEGNRLGGILQCLQWIKRGRSNMGGPIHYLLSSGQCMTRESGGVKVVEFDDDDDFKLDLV